jgi:hypothetical protein
MRLTIVVGLLIGILIVYGCSNLAVPASGNVEIPFPKTNGIIPLSFENHWVYSHTSFDSNGNRSGEQYNLLLTIGKVYQRAGDSLQLRDLFISDAIEPYCYEYQYDAQDTGLLIMNSTIGNAVRGTFILGKYTKTQRKLFKEPVLWLKYPADSGDKWTVTFENEHDTQLIQVMSTSATYYYVNTEKSVSPLAFLSGCYLYKVENGSRCTWMYYHESVGMLAFLEYEKGVLRRNGLLNSMHLSK